MSNILKPVITNTYIVHIDGDNFFASCELARFPHLKNVPVVIGRERGIAVAFNSQAKALGITRAMPIFQVRKQFQQAVILSSHFELYKFFSKRIATIVSKYVDLLEVYSIDEVFCLYTEKEDVLREMKNIQAEIYQKLGITVSIGIAKTKVLAKMATSVQKPNGVTLIDETNRLEILKNTAIGSVWGIGRRGKDYWLRRGIVSVFDFVSLTQAAIVRQHAPTQELYYELSGKSITPVGSRLGKAQQSFQSTESFPKTNERAFLFSEISRHVEILGVRLFSSGQYTSEFNFFLKDSDGRFFDKAIKLKNATQSTFIFLNTISEIFDELYKSNKLYKACGVTFMNLSSQVSDHKPLSLFDQLSEPIEPRITSSLESLKASIRAKNGYSSLYNASSAQSLSRKSDKRMELSVSDPYIYGLPLPFLGIVK